MARYINADTLLEQLRDAVSHKGMGAAIAGILIQYIEAMPMIERPATDGTVTIDAENVLSGLLHCKQDAGCKNCVECPYYLSKGQCTINLLNDAINTISNFEEQVDKAVEICHECHAKYAEQIKQAKQIEKARRKRPAMGIIDWYKTLKTNGPCVIIKDIENRTTLDNNDYEFIKQNFGKPLRVNRICWTREGSVHWLTVYSRSGTITLSPGRTGCTFEFI